MEAPTNTPIKAFSVYIQDKPYDVYNIDGKQHAGFNGTIKTWWLYYSDRLPDGVAPPVDSEHWEPFCVGINRWVWDIQIKQYNYTKHKWGDLDFRNSTRIEMHCNGKLVYAFTTSGGDRGLAFGMAKVQVLQVQLAEHPYNFFEPETERGRKIYWYGLPAIVLPHTDGWEISIAPDYTAGFTQEQWWKEYLRRKAKTPAPVDDEFQEMEAEDDAEDQQYGRINWGDALSDGHIDWFRRD